MSKKIRPENLDMDIEDLLVVLLQNEVIVDVNQKVSEVLEYQRDEVVGKNWFDRFVPESNREIWRDSYHKLLTGDSRIGYSERRVVTKTGEEHVAAWYSLPIKDEKNVFVGAILLGQDVTEKKLALEKYINLASFPAFDPNPIVEVDFEGNITFTNPAAKKVFPNLQKSYLKQIFLHDWNKISSAFENKVSMNPSFGREIQLGDHWYLQQFSVMPIGPRIRVYVVNIDEKKKTEEALKESEEKYRSLFENMINGYAYCEMIFNEDSKPVDFVYLEINSAFEVLTGLKRENVVGKRVSEVIPGTIEANPEIFEIYGRVSQTLIPESFEIFFKPLKIWFNIAVYGPKQGHFVAIFENITKRKELEDELNSYNQRLEDVVARRTAEYAQANKKLSREIMDRRKSEEGLLFRAMVLDNLSEAIFLGNLKGEFVYANLAACELFEYPCDELLARNLFDQLRLPELETKALMEKLQRDEEINVHTVYTKKNGEQVAIHLRMGSVKTAHGKLVISVIHEVKSEK